MNDCTLFRREMRHILDKVGKDVVDNGKGVMATHALLAVVLLKSHANLVFMQGSCKGFTDQDKDWCLAFDWFSHDSDGCGEVQKR